MKLLNFLVKRAPIWDFQTPPVVAKSEQKTKNPNNTALYCLKAVAGYRMDKERTENLLQQLEQEKVASKSESVASVEKIDKEVVP